MHTVSQPDERTVTLNTRYLQEYLVFADELNYSIAAQRLFISRPTLNDHLESLENELGCTLIAHGAKPTLTPQGRKFVNTATKLLREWDDIVQEFHQLEDNLLSVKVSSTNLPWLESVLMKARLNILKAFPTSTIEIITENGPLASIDALDEHANDITVVGIKQFTPDFVPEPLQNRPRIRLHTEEIFLFMTEGNALFEKETIYPADLQGRTLLLPPDVYQSYIRDGVEAYLNSHDAHVSLQSMPFRDHYEYFAHDFGQDIGVVPTTLNPRFGLDLRPDCRVFSLEGLPLVSSFYAFFRESFLDNPRGRLLFEEMKRLAESSS